MSDGALLEVATDEIIARASENMLKDSDAIERLIAENRTLGEKILEFIGDAAERLKSILKEFEGEESLREEARLLREMVDTYEEAKAKWSAAFARSAANVSAANAAGVVGDVENGGEVMYSEEDVEITLEDVQTLRSIGRKSINAFTSEDIKKAEPWARKFFRELGVKSPFFRAWFGDWRANDDKTLRTFIDVNTSPIKATEVSRVGATNNDTGWEIKVNRDGIDETANKKGKWSDEYHSLKSINDMLANAILVDTVVVTDPSKRLGKSTAFVHHMYCPIKVGDVNAIAKMYITEEIGNVNKFYLTKIETVPTDSTVLSTSAVAPNSSVGTTISVSQIYEFVKMHNADYESDSEYPTDFSPKSASKVVNADGTPKVVYHQTGANFTVFNTDNPVAGLNDSETPNGIFFKDNDHDIGLSGQNQMAVYLNARKILHFKNRKQANAWYCEKIPGYKKLQDEFNSIHETEFKPKFDAIDAEMFSSEITDERYDELDLEEEALIEKLRTIENSYSAQMRDLLDKYFLDGNSGYDAIELDYDGHRWVNGKKEDVHTYIVFKPTQIKSATDNIGTFDAANPDIRYSEYDDTSMREVLSGALLETAQNDAERSAVEEYQGKSNVLSYNKGRYGNFRLQISILVSY